MAIAISTERQNSFNLTSKDAELINRHPQLKLLPDQSNLVQASFKQPDGTLISVEATLSRGAKGLFLTSSGYPEVKWPDRSSELKELSFVHVVNRDEIATIKLISAPENFQQAFEFNQGSSLRVRTDKKYEILDIYILSVNHDGTIIAADLDSKGTANKLCFKLGENSELLQIEDGDIINKGKISSITATSFGIRANLKQQELASISVVNDDGRQFSDLSALDLLRKGTEVNLSYEVNKRTIEGKVKWAGIHQDSALVYTGLNDVRLIPLDSLISIDSFTDWRTAYDKSIDLAHILSAIPKNRPAAPGSYSVDLSTPGRVSIANAASEAEKII